MEFVADLHIHSPYSRATSPRMSLEKLHQWAKTKGVQLLATGDFTHPEWVKSLKEDLRPTEEGLFSLKSKEDEGVRFVLSTEISCIYSKGGKVRKIHLLILAPSLEAVDRINQKLSSLGKLASDGRPILGLDAKNLLEIVLNASEQCLVIPAHVMTPWFALFGSKSGFDSLEECFEEHSEHIFALETGLSADPSMIWRLPEGERLTLISNSDAHSPGNIAREANVFNTEMSYSSVINAIKPGGDSGLSYTIEFFPQEGKYHFDGHRACDLRLSPQETKKYNNVCPRCGKPLTIGVMNRIEELAVKPEGFKPDQSPPFKSLVPLKEIIAEVFDVGTKTKTVEKEYRRIIKEFNNELEVLLRVSQKELEHVTLPEIAEGVARVREGRVSIEPGYDGVYGEVKIFSEHEHKILSESKQKVLF